MRTGFLRLWIVMTAFWLVGWGLKGVADRWWEPTCFRFFTVSISSNAKTEDKALAESNKNELLATVYCGDRGDSALLTLEDLAKRQVVTQVTTTWLTPSGWSDTFGSLDIFGDFNSETKPVTVANIQASMSSLAQKSRLSAIYKLAPVILGAPIFLLCVGLAIFWVATGFRRKTV